MISVFERTKSCMIFSMTSTWFTTLSFKNCTGSVILFGYIVRIEKNVAVKKVFDSKINITVPADSHSIELKTAVMSCFIVFMISMLAAYVSSWISLINIPQNSLHKYVEFKRSPCSKISQGIKRLGDVSNYVEKAAGVAQPRSVWSDYFMEYFIPTQLSKLMSLTTDLYGTLFF